MHYGSQTPAGQWPFDESQPTGPGLPIWPAIERHPPTAAAPGIPQYVQPPQYHVPTATYQPQPHGHFSGGGAPAGSAAQVVELGFAYPVAGMPATFPGMMTDQLPALGETPSLSPRPKNGRGWRIRWVNLIALIALASLCGATAAFAMNYDAIMNPDSAKSAGKPSKSAKNKSGSEVASPALANTGENDPAAVDPAKPTPAAQAVLTQGEVDTALAKAQALSAQGKLGKASAVLHPLLDRTGSSKFPELTKLHKAIDGRITRADAAVKAARIKLDNGNVSGAKTQLAQAEKLYPGRSDVKALMARANKLGASDASGGGAAGTGNPAGVKPTGTKKPVDHSNHTGGGPQTAPAPGTTGGTTTKPPPAATKPAPLPSAPSVSPPGGGTAAPPSAALPSAANGGPSVTPTDSHDHAH